MHTHIHSGLHTASPCAKKKKTQRNKGARNFLNRALLRATKKKKSDHREKIRRSNLSDLCVSLALSVSGCSLALLRLEDEADDDDDEDLASWSASMKLTWWSNLTRSLVPSSALVSVHSLLCCCCCLSSAGLRLARFAMLAPAPVLGPISSSELSEAAWPEDESVVAVQAAEEEEDADGGSLKLEGGSSFMLRTEPARARVEAEPSSGAIEALTDFSDRLQVAAEAVSLHRLNRCVDVTSAWTSSLLAYVRVFLNTD